VKKLRVGIIFGGRSGEHEVSVTSAASIFKHIDRAKYEPIAIRIEKTGRWSFPTRAARRRTSRRRFNSAGAAHRRRPRATLDSAR
jgi:D-alanine-D-alanine ligase